MSFYSQFADLYEAVFPYRQPVCDFLAARVPPVPPNGASPVAQRPRLLDIGCGPGHYAGRLAERGLNALGIDLDAGMVATAQRRYPAATFQLLDMRAIDRLPGPFDLALCIGNTAAHLPPDELSAFLARLARLLRPGARWIVQVVNWDFIVKRGDYRFPDRPVTAPAAAAGSAAAGPSGRLVFRREYREVTPRRVRFLTRLDREDPDGPRTLWEGDTVLYPLLAADGIARHAAAGFVLEEHLADYDGRGFTPDREGANIMVCRRAG